VTKSHAVLGPGVDWLREREGRLREMWGKGAGGGWPGCGASKSVFFWLAGGENCTDGIKAEPGGNDEESANAGGGRGGAPSTAVEGFGVRGHQWPLMGDWTAEDRGAGTATGGSGGGGGVGLRR